MSVFRIVVVCWGLIQQLKKKTVLSCFTSLLFSPVIIIIIRLEVI